MNRRNRRILIDGLSALKVTLPDGGVDKLVRYCDEISLWNNKMNLVGGTEVDIVVRHILDSLAVVPILNDLTADLGDKLTLADVGSGAGFPGIPLAIAIERVSVSLIERSARRASFLTTIRLLLEIANITVVEEDVTDKRSNQSGYLPALEHAFDLVVCRAYQPFEIAIPVLQHLRRDGGMIAYYAASPPEEVQPDSLSRTDYDILVPNLDAKRTLVVLRQA